MKNAAKLLSLSFILLIVAGCAQQVATPQPAANNTPPLTTQVTPITAQTQTTVSISNFAFDPQTTTVKAGTTVTWNNHDSVAHKIISDANPPVFSSENLSKDGSYSFTFTTAGSFDYFCQIHPMMKGTIVVTQ